MKKMTTKRGLETSNEETDKKSESTLKTEKIARVENFTFGQKVNGQ